MNDEVIKLILDLAGSSKDVSELVGKLGELKTATSKVAESYDVLMGELGTYEVLERRMVESQSMMVDATNAFQSSVNSLAGKPGARGNTGQGILGASYAVQDFVSVLSGGQGLGRALGAVTNNVAPVLMSLGSGPGMAGVVGLVVVGITAAIPLIEKFFDGFAGGKAELAKETLKQIEERIKKIGDEFRKLVERPSDLEAQAAQEVADYFGQRGVAPAVARGMTKAMTEGEIDEAMKRRTKNEQGEMVFEHHGAREAQAQADQARRALEGARRDLAGGANFMTPERVADLERATAQLEERARLARSQVAEIEARRLVAEATKPTPEGRAAKGRLERAAGAHPELFPGGFGTTMRASTPDQIAADEREADEWEATTRQWEENARRRREARKAKQAQDKAMEDAEAQAAKTAAEMDKAMERDLQQGIKLGREAGKAAAKMKATDAWDLKGMDLGHLPLVGPNATPEQAEAIMAHGQQRADVAAAQAMNSLLRNQDKLNGQARIMFEKIQRDAEAVGGAIQANRSFGSGGTF